MGADAPYPLHDKRRRPKTGLLCAAVQLVQSKVQFNGSNDFVSSIHELKSDLYKPSCPAVTKTRRRRDPIRGGNLINKLLLTIIRRYPLI
jgi:hypothetical protein